MTEAEMRQEVQRIADVAAKLLRDGVTFKNAVGAALDRFRITDPATRRKFFSIVCSSLGKRGAEAVAKNRALASASAK